MKISFDFDCTLTNNKISEVAKALIDVGHYVRITTSRRKEKNDDLLLKAKELGISDIVFTEGKDKFSFLNEFDIHFDDDNYEVMLINTRTKCKAILVEYDEMI